MVSHPASQRRRPSQTDSDDIGNRSGFRTDTAISNNRFGNERVLQPWVPDAKDALDGSLEKSSGSGGWDQFAENERLFGVKTDYDENIYTTAIDRSHPQYRERVAAAERKAREIENSTATTAHVAEERVMDYVAGNDKGTENEEDKYANVLASLSISSANNCYRYSGVRRQDSSNLSGARENKYTPPAKRAPTGQSTTKGVPVDPAIISSQIRAPAKKASPNPEQAKAQAPSQGKNGVVPKADGQKIADPKPVEDKPVESKPVGSASDPKAAESSGTPARSGAAGRNMSPQLQEGTPSATSTVERDVLKEFKTFATQQRTAAENIRTNKAKADKEVKLTELKKFANSFKLSTPVPNDLVSIIAKDPLKQKEIQAKAMKNVEDVAKTKVDTGKKETTPTPKDAQPKSTKQSPVPVAADTRGPRTTAPTQPTPAPGAPSRHQGPRQQYPPAQYQAQTYRNTRGNPQHVAPQQQTGGLAVRLRNVEQQKFSQPQVPHQQPPPTAPTGPANGDGMRRLSGVPGHLAGPKLNPNSHEFKPSPFAQSFSPNGHPSASSSPRSSVNHAIETPSSVAPAGQLIRRKTKAVDTKKCNILLHVKSINPPPGRNWDDNGGLRPPYDTYPTWRQIQDDEKPDSTMQLTYKELFDRQPFFGPSMSTPNPAHVAPQLAHQHQLPFHMQHGASNMGARQSPHMPPMRMDAPQHGHAPQPPYGNDDHRMMQSNSAQSFASPRPGQVPMAYPGMNSPAQMPYNGPVFMPGTPNMAQYQRSFSNNQQYMQPQQGHMGGPMMMQPQYMPGHQGMVGAPQMMYPGQHPQFMPPSGPPQQMPGANGYPSPGRQAAPMMAHQGSQPGQPMYGMSPNVQYNQPAYGSGQLNGQSQ